MGGHRGYGFSRKSNLARTALEKTLTALEGGLGGLAFGSGMAAIDAVLRLLLPGDQLLAGNDLHGGSDRLFQNVYAQHGLER